MSAVSIKRRDLLKAGGALVIAFRFLAVENLWAQETAATTTSRISGGPPDPTLLNSWIAIHEDNSATLYIGFAELGQGCSTALLQVAAEELDLSLEQMHIADLSTRRSPNQGGTYSSSAIRRGAPQVQRAAAEARAALLELAAARLGVPASSLQVDKGVISAGGDDNAVTTYGEVLGGRYFARQIGTTAPLKAVADYRLVGQPLPRKDIPAKAAGSYVFIQHLRLPDMLHARLVRPRGQAAYREGVSLLSVDESSLAGIPAVVLRQGDFLAVAADREWDAVRAASALRVEWAAPALLPPYEDLFLRLEAAPATDRVAAERGDVSAYAAAPFRCEFKASAPYQAHVPFAPNCALAHVVTDSARVLCSSQDIHNTRAVLARVLGFPFERVGVEYHEGSGTFGHSCWDDAAIAAALASKLAGRPIRLQLMRWDEHGWDNYGPAHLGIARVSADSDGKLLSYDYEGWQHHWSLIETSEQSATGAPAQEWPPFPAMQLNPLVLGGMYDIPNLRLLNHHVDGLDWPKAGWLRSPLDLAFTFVSEQAIDDLAFQMDQDPYQFRRRNISNERWLGVLDAAAQAANWQDRPAHSARAASDSSAISSSSVTSRSSGVGDETPAAFAAAANGDAGLLRGRGIGLGTHLASWGAAVAEVEVNPANGAVRILHLAAALDAGLVVNPANVENQIIGQLVQTASRMLLEEVRFENGRVNTLDWATYPILRMADCPRITPVIVQRPDQPPSGAGEEVMAAAAAAIANAFFDATGRRMRMFPFTPQRVLAALEEPPANTVA